VLYALVASDCSFAVDVFVTRALAERSLADVLRDEPTFAPLLSIEEIRPPRLHEGDGGPYVRRL
jgi:hypothetical protein